MVTVRPLDASDADAYRAIRLEALTLAPEAFGSTLAREQGFSRAEFAARLAGGRMLGAFAGAALAGVAGLLVEEREKERHKGTLVGMYVRPDMRGRGIGRLLVDAVLAAAAGEVEQVRLAVVAGNAAARALYERCGFAAYGLERRALKAGGVYYDELLMARFLPPRGGSLYEEPDSRTEPPP